jgi:hypothetical protein
MAQDRSRHSAARSRRRHVARTAAIAAGVGDARGAGRVGAGGALTALLVAVVTRVGALS